VFVIVVSEETGRISIARNGALTSGLTIQKLRAEMEESFGNQKFDDDVAFSSQADINLS
jgi:diadenylate cyclase